MQECDVETRSALADATRRRVLADVIARDRRDSDRAAAPLAIAPDAVVIDTTAMAIDQAVAAACDVVQAALDKAALDKSGGGVGR